jgi:hypothetical protein
MYQDRFAVSDSTYGADLALSRSIQRLDILLYLLMVDIGVLIPLPTESHVEHPTELSQFPSYRSGVKAKVIPLSFHRQLSLDDLDEILVVHPSITFLEHEDLLVGSTEENLVEQILVRARTLASAIEQVQVSTQRTERKQDKCVFQPDLFSTSPDRPWIDWPSPG